MYKNNTSLSWNRLTNFRIRQKIPKAWTPKVKFKLIFYSTWHRSPKYLTESQGSMTRNFRLFCQIFLANQLHRRHPCQASKFQIECTCLSGKWIVKITCPNVPFTCLKYIKPMQLMWKSEMRSRASDKSCRYSTCPIVIFTCLRRSDEWNLEPCMSSSTLTMRSQHLSTGLRWNSLMGFEESLAVTWCMLWLVISMA